jgi:hypothetical protein
VHFIDARGAAGTAGVLEYMLAATVRERFGLPRYSSVLHANGTFEFSGLDPAKCNVTVVQCVPLSSVLAQIGLREADLMILVRYLNVL